MERKKAERSGAPFLLMLLEIDELSRNGGSPAIAKIGDALNSAIRDTDVVGWYRTPSVIGVIFTALEKNDCDAIESAILEKVHRAMRENLAPVQAQKVRISLHFFPERNTGNTVLTPDEKLYPDLEERGAPRFLYTALKRAIDILGSLLALVALSPLFVIIALMVKLSSKGPVLFKQERLGRSAREFAFLKFRSMFTNSDPEIHRRYVRQLIIKASDQGAAGANPGDIYKIRNDPRVTPLGRWLRKTSLDELPQFLNVLKGDMSLVGPRPPIRYEFECYSLWHRRRVMEAKPGITGLWQVNGRSRTTFDEMVRLDLQYIRRRSLWLDLKILLHTPAAVMRGTGAY